MGNLQLELLWCRVPSSGKARDMPRLWDQPFAELEEGWKVENRRNIMVNFSSSDTNDYIFSFEQLIDHMSIGRDEIRKLASALHLPTSTEEQAFGIYKLAATNNFIQGRRTRTVAAVCLYVACRRVSGNTVLLMDLAEKIQVCYFCISIPDFRSDFFSGERIQIRRSLQGARERFMVRRYWSIWCECSVRS